MKVGVIGSGDVGCALATGFANLGHEVKIGTMHPDNDKVKAWLESTKGKKTSVGSFSETATFGDVVVIAVRGEAINDVLKQAGPGNFYGKTVIDVTNPLVFEKGKPPSLSVGFSDSAGEQIQRALPGAHVVKTLNIIGNAMMVNPTLKQGDPDMLLCGNDENAKKQVVQMLKDFGWKNITDLGGIEQSRTMEPLCILWVTYGMKNNSWTHAIKMLKE